MRGSATFPPTTSTTVGDPPSGGPASGGFKQHGRHASSRTEERRRAAPASSHALGNFRLRLYHEVRSTSTLEVYRKLVMGPLPNEFASRSEPGDANIVDGEYTYIGA